MASLMDAGVSAPAGEGLQNLEAEAALLGAVLIENGVLDHLPELRPEHFAEPLHERIFAAITGEIEKGRRATPLTLRPLFESDLAIKELGGAKYLAQLTADGAGLLAPRELSEQIIDLSYRRSMLARLQDAREGLLDPALPLPDLSALADPDCSASRAPRQTLPFEWAGKAQAVLDDLWLINGWLPRNGLGVIYGHPGSGKTFLALHMAQHVATGSAWAGRDVERGLVLYLAAEGQTGFRNRLAAMRQEGHLPADAPFVFVPVPIDLQAEQGEVTRLIATLNMISKQCDLPPALVVIDTLSKTFGAGKENTDDMASYVANCQRIASKFECFTLIVHHRPKGEDAADLRGHSSLKGGIDTAILVESRTLKTAKITKQKDGEDGLSVQFSLDQIELGQDKQGNVITSCVVSIAEDEIEHARGLSDGYGLGTDGRGYVLADYSCNLSPDGWARRVVDAYEHFEADRVVAEKNFGGAMVEAVLRTAAEHLPVTLVTASRGKVVRAEPVAALYEQGKVSHVGAFDELEDQMTEMTSAGFVGEGSPDRADALVWALTELMLEPQSTYTLDNL